MITGIDASKEFFVCGFIMAKNEPLIETAWNSNGKNISNSRFDINRVNKKVIREFLHKEVAVN